MQMDGHSIESTKPAAKFSGDLHDDNFRRLDDRRPTDTSTRPGVKL